MIATHNHNWCHPGNFKPGALEDPRNCTDILGADGVPPPPSGFFGIAIEDELNEAKRKMDTSDPVKYDDDMEELRSKCVNEKDKIFCVIINDLPNPEVQPVRAIFYLIEEILYEEYRNKHALPGGAFAHISSEIRKKFSDQELAEAEKMVNEMELARHEKWKNIKLIFQKKVLVNPEETVREIFTKARNSWLSRECLKRCEGRPPTKACLKRCEGRPPTKACLKRCEHALVRPPTIDEGDLLNNPSSITDEDGGREPVWVEQLAGWGQLRCGYLNLKTGAQKSAAPDAPTINKCVLEQWYNDLLEAALGETNLSKTFLPILRSPDNQYHGDLTRALLKIIQASLSASIQPDDGTGTGLRRRRHVTKTQAQKFQKAEAAIKKLDNLREKYIPHSLRPDTFAGGPESRRRWKTALQALAAAARVQAAPLAVLRARIQIPAAPAAPAMSPANAAFLLGVQPNASKKEINHAWRLCGLKHHPDKGGSNEAFQERCHNPRDILLSPKSGRKGGHRVRIEKRKKSRRHKKKKRKKTRHRKKNKRKKTRRHKKKKRKKTRRGKM